MIHCNTNDTCPVCGSTNIEGDGAEFYSGGIQQRVACLECGASWYDDYVLKGYDNIKFSSLAPIIKLEPHVLGPTEYELLNGYESWRERVMFEINDYGFFGSDYDIYVENHIVQRTLLFCYRADSESPIVDYEISYDEFMLWFHGIKPLVVSPKPHDPNRFSTDVDFTKQQPSETGYRCPRCGSTEAFYCDRINVETAGTITRNGWIIDEEEEQEFNVSQFANFKCHACGYESYPDVFKAE